MTDHSLTNKDTEEKNPDIQIIDKLNLPDHEKKQLIAHLEMYSGPIPHPDILKKYEEIYPGAAKEIIDNGVEESRHRRSLEDDRQKRRGHLSWAALIILSVVSVVFIFLSFFLIMNGHPLIGSIFSGGSIIIFLGSLINLVPTLSSSDDISTTNKGKDVSK